MDAGTITAAISAIAGAIGAAGGFVGGRRVAGGQALDIAIGTVELLQVRVDTLTTLGEEKDARLKDLGSRVDLLEGLVTQRAQVEAVREGVMGVWGVVDRIATKVGA